MTPSQEGPALEARRLTKRFGRSPALSELDLSLGRRELHVLFGNNGAGKSTFLRLASTLMRPTSGEILFHGKKLSELGDEVRRQVGLVSHASFLYPSLTPRENLEFYARLHGLSSTSDAVASALDWAELSLRRNSATRSLSRGMQQRLALARALLHQPQLLLLDEPYTGLDAASCDKLTARLKTLTREGGITILLTTHDIERGVSLADRVLILEAGRLVFNEQRPVSANTVRKQLTNPG